MMAFSSGLRVPTISAQREREREAGESERRRKGGRGRARGSCGKDSAGSGLEARPRLRPAWVRLAKGKGGHPKGTDSFPNQARVWDTLARKPWLGLEGSCLHYLIFLKTYVGSMSFVTTYHLSTNPQSSPGVSE